LFNSCLLKAEEKKVGPPPAAAAAGGPQAKGGKEGSAYIAPALRDGGNRKGETMAMGRRSKIYFLHSSLFYIFRKYQKAYIKTIFDYPFLSR
jgi:hypothetical protein